MKLKDYLETLEDDEIVAIGVERRYNSGFAYISKARNYDLIEKAFEDHLKNVQRKLRRKLAELNRLMVLKKDQYDILEQAEKICSAYQMAEGYKEYIDTYISPLEREVIETYDKYYDDATAIIIKGKEAGMFYLKEEFDKKYC